VEWLGHVLWPLGGLLLLPSPLHNVVEIIEIHGLAGSAGNETTKLVTSSLAKAGVDTNASEAIGAATGGAVGGGVAAGTAIGGAAIMGAEIGEFTPGLHMLRDINPTKGKATKWTRHTVSFLLLQYHLPPHRIPSTPFRIAKFPMPCMAFSVVLIDSLSVGLIVGSIVHVSLTYPQHFIHSSTNATPLNSG
jgi:hypothetical protein